MEKKDFELNLPKPKTEAMHATLLNKVDIQELCDATEDAIIADGGFGWLKSSEKN